MEIYCREGDEGAIALQLVNSFPIETTVFSHEYEITPVPKEEEKRILAEAPPEIVQEALMRDVEEESDNDS